ncbi:DUF4112 domain-containing protein [Wenxinia marina]|uniref:DUF4112 domain-containing protein n=1 Tax=Wenxinia marina DSM 24838 TaxID=1123501 RepID=A0A0D0NKD0_9RHOB|nr:DUF4112 domain-containing protein [Wenxinia marina]KIQ68775.1 hypothetical protein Wenmar_02502 [Wenxinia marina DSM 24838]GGL65273.1 hypothetical protein GCM10011392_19960 [Wenxinia marina]
MSYADRTDDAPVRAASTPRRIDRQRELDRLDRLANLLDARFGVPGTRFSFGWDSIIGLVPGIGDAVAFAPSAWLIWRAKELGAPTSTLTRMAFNTGIDTAIGAIPILGDIFDAAFKANLRNVELLRAHLRDEGTIEQPGDQPGRARPR